MFDFFFPNHTCLVCGNEISGGANGYVCGPCAEALPINTECPTLQIEGATQHFHRAYSAFRYEEPIVKLILNLKYGADGDAAVMFAPYMAAAYLYANGTAEQKPVLLPVPLAKKRARTRGYNQSLLLAKQISKILDFPVADGVLTRTKATTAQKHMSPAERVANLSGAFSVDTPAADIIGKNVVIVDDVFTTGATANECARVLIEAGAERVEVLTIAARI